MGEICIPRHEVAEYASGLLESAMLLEDLGFPLAAEIHRLATRLESQLYGDLPDVEGDLDE
jgi:hypothetical protein